MRLAPFTLLIPATLWFGCNTGSTPPKKPVPNTDSTQYQSNTYSVDSQFIATPHQLEELEWTVLRDTTQPANTFQGFDDRYTQNPEDITTFRGDHKRNSSSIGTITGKPIGLKPDWTFITRTDEIHKSHDGSKYSKMSWGGGSGWTGQPLIIQWPQAMKKSLGITDPAFINNPLAKEVIIGSLSGDIYFLNLETGQPTREPLTIDGPIKGTVTIDPRLNGMLYVGQGIGKGKRFGAYLIDMVQRKVTLHQPGIDRDARRRWGAFDSSPLMDGRSGTLFWPAENGLIYSFNVQNKDTPFVQAKLRYRHSELSRIGLEASMSSIGRYGFVADNSGTLLCLDLVTLEPIWYTDNYDDTDASLTIDREKDQYYLYVGNEVDHRKPKASAQLRKISAKDGTPQWEVARICSGTQLNGRDNSGGILPTPLVGKKKGENIVIALFSRVNGLRQSELVAIEKTTGRELYTVLLDSYTWASPVDFYDAQGNMYLFFTDVSGNQYILDGLTGKLIFKTEADIIHESSPVIVGDRIVVGTRGKTILSYKIITE